MSQTPLAIERDASGPGLPVVTLTLDQPGRKVLVLDRALLASIDAALNKIGTDLRGFVLASASRVFVAGADLREIDALDDAELDAYLAFGQRVFARIAALPCTTVAAINGAALGGGLELAMHCDVLLALRPADPAKPYQIGLPEASLGLCPGWGGTNLLPARVEPGLAVTLTASGKPISVEEAHKHGLISDLFDAPESLIADARRRAREPKPARARPDEPLNLSEPAVRGRVAAAMQRVEPGLPDTDASRGVAECVREGLRAGWRASLEAERRTLVRLRSTDAARTALKAFFDRTAGR